MSLEQLEKLSDLELERIIINARSIYSKRYYQKNKDAILKQQKQYRMRKKYGISG